MDLWTFDDKLTSTYMSFSSKQYYGYSSTSYHILLFKVEARRKEAEEAARAARQKYSSQFNPEAARQNKLDSKRKYWLD